MITFYCHAIFIHYFFAENYRACTHPSSRDDDTIGKREINYLYIYIIFLDLHENAFEYK